MFQRLLAALRSFFGLFVRGLERPEVMLEQYIDDLRAQVPRLNDTVAEVVKTEILLRGQVEALERKIADLDRQIVTALKMGPQYEEDAKTLIAAMERDKESLEDTREQWEAAKRASEHAKQAREEYLRTMDEKIQRAMQAVSRAKQAEMQERVSGLMMSFQLGDQTDVLERMEEKINERAAKAQARAELATTGVDARLQDIRRATAQIGVEERLLEYKRQLGLAPAEPQGERRLEPMPQAEPPQAS